MEIFELGELLIALRNYRIGRAPIKTDRVPFDPRIRFSGMDGARVVHHQCVVLKRSKPMRTPGGNKQHVPIFSGQRKGKALAKGRLRLPEIQDDIPCAAMGAINQLVVILWRELKMHSSNHPLVRNGEKLFSGREDHTEFLEQLSMKGLNERSSVVRKNPGAYDLKASEGRLFEGEHRSVGHCERTDGADFVVKHVRI